MVSDGHSMYAYILKENEFAHVMVDHTKRKYVKDGFHTKVPIQIMNGLIPVLTETDINS